MTNPTRDTSAEKPRLIISLVMVTAAVAIALIPGAANLLQFDRAECLTHRATWQLFTCHWTHWSLSHLFWDTLALGVLGFLCERDNRRRFLICIAIAAPAIPLVLSYTEAWMETYRGLSGIDSALFALFVSGLIRTAARDKDRVVILSAAVMFAAFGGKLTFEFLAGQSIFVDSSAAGMVPVPMAHAVGMLVGLAVGLAPDTDVAAREFVPATLAHPSSDSLTAPKENCEEKFAARRLRCRLVHPRLVTILAGRSTSGRPPAIPEQSG